MLDFQQKRKVRGIIYHPATLAILFLLTLVILHSTWKVYMKKRESEEMKALSQQHVEDLRKRSEELTSKIEKLATISGVEKEIRSKFSVTKDQENMVVVVPDNTDKISTTTKKASLWQRFWGFFKI